MGDKKDIKIKPAKGRPMLTWVGKRPLKSVTAFPAQHIETFSVAPSPLEGEGGSEGKDIWKDGPDSYPKGGLLFHGDNKEVLAHLLANGFRGKINLIYIDPPFDSGADYVRKVQLRGVTGTTKIEGETYTLGEQIQYTDIWANDNYLQFMYERLMLLKELLVEDGAIVLHCDWKRVHLLRLVLDEVFGSEGFRNEIIRIKCNPKNSKRKAFGNIHDTLLFYSKGNSEKRVWTPLRESVDSEDLLRLFGKIHPSTGRSYTTVALHARGTRRGETGQPWRNIPPPPGRHWAFVHKQLDEFDAVGLIEWSSTGNPRLIRYADEKGGDLVQDIWTMKDPEENQYPTEKPEELIGRFILACTKKGDLVLDSFIGSGTTAAVAQKLGRRWIGCDINKGAIHTTSKRIQTIIQEQIDESDKAKEKNAQGKLIETDEEEEGIKPAQLAFTIWRVNDYDLQIQHNEAVKLACEHVGIERTRSDSFFEGVLGKKLVKIVPFNHPLSPLDLEEIKRELEARPEEDRNIVVVCLGKELAADTWIEDWNRLRKGKNALNKIDIIELRSDPKYGKFIAHKPATAKVSIQRIKDKIKILIEDFISPTIIDRLDMDVQVFKAKITDWRSMVDCVMIDTAYNSEIFNVVFSDVPEKKTDLVLGTYELSAPDGKTTVALKIIDMLGEEVVFTREI